MAEIINNISRINHRVSSGLVTFGDVHYEARGSCGPRIQKDYQLVTLHEGEAEIQIDKMKVLVQKGQTILLKPGRREFFQFSKKKMTHHSWCAISPKLVPRGLAAQLEKNVSLEPFTSQFENLMSLAFKLSSVGTSSKNQYLQSLGIAALTQFLMLSDESEKRTLPLPIMKARQFIHSHFMDPLDLTKIARAASVTPQHLHKIFKNNLKTSPIKYLWEFRTREGMERLSQTGLSISEIAYACGFQNPFHFSRMIKQQYGKSPRVLRKKLWNA